MAGQPPQAVDGPAREHARGRRQGAAPAGRGGAGPDPMPERVRPMLAASADQPFDSPQYLFEPKWDGVRAVGFRRDGRVWLQSRRGLDFSHAFPEVAQALQEVPGPRRAIVDGEVVTPGTDGRPNFAAALARSRMARDAAVEEAAREWPAMFVIFDLLYWEGRDLRGQPLKARRDALTRWVSTWPSGLCLALSPSVAGRGRELFEAARRSGLEGVVAKHRESFYREGRSRAWLKVKAFHEQVAVVAGFVPDGTASVRSLAVALPRPAAAAAPAPAGTARPAPGPTAPAHAALLEAGCTPAMPLELAGLVGTGLPGAERTRLRRRLEALRQARPAPQVAFEAAAAGKHPELRDVVWVRPVLFCRVRFLERTPDGWLRHASYRGLVES